MTHQYTAHFSIRQYELNSRGELPNSTIQRLFQETATLATRDLGFDVKYSAERESVWVIHQMTLEHLRPIVYPDELAITTWLSDAQRVRTHREYLARNAATGEIVARGRAHWAHLSAKTLRPLRIPSELFEIFGPNGIRAVPRVETRSYRPPSFEFREFRTTRHVHRYEADEMKHVNNAMYLDWLEETLTDAVETLPSTASSFSLRQAQGRSETAQDARRLWVYRHAIEYVRSAVPGDDVEMVVRLVGTGKTASTWNLEIMRSGESLVKDHITALWVNDAGEPVRW